MSTPIEYGRKITLDEANSIIKEHEDLLQKIELTPIEGLSDRDQMLANEFIKRDKNAFVFSMDLIDRFREKNPNANYLVVLKGAHPMSPKTSNSRAGSFTIVTAGCTGTYEGGQLTLRTLSIENPANQYPDKRVITTLVKGTESGSGNFIEFTVL